MIGVHDISSTSITLELGMYAPLVLVCHVIGLDRVNFPIHNYGMW